MQHWLCTVFHNIWLALVKAFHKYYLQTLTWKSIMKEAGHSQRTNEICKTDDQELHLDMQRKILFSFVFLPLIAKTAWCKVVKSTFFFFLNPQLNNNNKRKTHVSNLQIFKKVNLFFSIGILKYIPSKIVWHISTVEKKRYTNDEGFEAKRL